MRILADFIMRERMHAIVIMAICLAIPDFSWLGAAVASLVLLRKGINNALGIFFIGVAVTLIGWCFGMIMPPFILLSSLLLAQTLRATVSWIKVLLCSIGIGLFCYGVLMSFPIHEVKLAIDKLNTTLPSLLMDSYQLTHEQSENIATLVLPVVVPMVYAFGIQIFSIISVMLARYWQALLYNPGGFRSEVYQLKMPKAYTALLCLGMIVLPTIYYPAVALFLLCSVPLFFTGLAVVQGIMDKVKLPRLVMVAFYIMFVLLIGFVYPLLVILAIIDSIFNLRKLDAQQA